MYVESQPNLNNVAFTSSWKDCTYDTFNLLYIFLTGSVVSECRPERVGGYFAACLPLQASFYTCLYIWLLLIDWAILQISLLFIKRKKGAGVFMIMDANFFIRIFTDGDLGNLTCKIKEKKIIIIRFYTKSFNISRNSI